VEVKDGEFTKTTSVTINVTNVNENPTIQANQAFLVLENTPVNTQVGKVIASDPEGDNIKYSIVPSELPPDFTINSLTGIIKVANSPDFETTGAYPLIVKVEDEHIVTKKQQNNAVVTVYV